MDGGFPGGAVVKNPPAMQEMQVQPLGWESPWRRKWQPNPHKYSCLGNPMDREAWWTVVHVVTTKSWTQISI